MPKPIHLAFAVALAATPGLAQAAHAPATAKPKSAAAAGVAGQWQGKLGTLRLVLKVAKTASGYAADLYSLDQSGTAIPLDAFTLTGSAVNFTSAGMGASYEGRLSADGRTIKGTYTQGAPQPLDLVRTTRQTAWAIDPTRHKIRFVTTNDHVKLEVVDWGGKGRPLVFIPGLGADAHIFDKFAPRFTAKYHVYGVSRRGFGASDHPDPAKGANYMADRLGDDVLDVMDALKLDRPVLAGWSLGGEEMSSIATRKPDRIAGVVYLDAAYAYAFYSPGNLVSPDINVSIDINDLRAKFAQAAENDVSAADGEAIIDTLVKDDLPQLQADLAAARRDLAETTPPRTASPSTLDSRILQAIDAGMQKYGAISVPSLAIYASPHERAEKQTDAERAQSDQLDIAVEDQVKRFEAGHPGAKVVRLPKASHAVFLSNPEEVAREMNGFMDGLR